MLKTDLEAPEFVLQNDQGVDMSLTDLLAEGPLILYFYPADFTPGCIMEACSIRDIHDDLADIFIGQHEAFIKKAIALRESARD